MAGPDVTVVLAVYRNRTELPELCRRLVEVLEPYEAELLFVEDCGQDGSRKWLEQRSVGDPAVRLLSMAENRGQHSAVLRGLAAARGRRIVVMDADLQDLPEDVPRLLEAVGSRDVVVFARRTARHQSLVRHVTGGGFKRLLRFIAHSRIPPGTGMFFATSDRIRRAAVALGRAERHSYVPLLLDLTGAPMEAVDLPKCRRPEGGSGYSGWKRFRLGLRALMQAVRWRLRSGRTPTAEGEFVFRDRDAGRS